MLTLLVLGAASALGETFYVIEAGVAKQRSPWETSPPLVGMAHVTVIGAAKRPGVYFFRGSIPLAQLIEFLGTESDAHAESPDLSKVRLIYFDGRLFRDSVTINVHSVLASERRDALWILEGNEVIYIPALLGL